MKYFKKILTLLLLLSTLLCGCSTSSKSGTLKVGVRDDIMNFGYLNQETGKYYGMEIDLARQLADDLGYSDVEFITVTPDNREDMLLQGNVNCLIAVYSVNESRLESFDFSPVYYSDYSSIMVEKSSMIPSINELVGKKIGVLDGASAAPKLSEKMIALGLITAEDSKGTSLESRTSYAELSQALEEGTVDVVCMDGCIANIYMNEHRIILPDTIAEESYAVATQKGSELSTAVSQCVQKRLDDGTINKLIDKWD